MKIYKLVGITLFLLVSWVFTSCDGMNEIQEEFSERESRVYLGKVDSIKSFPGFGRAKITWYISSDPKIDKTVIYWNMRKDSLVKEFVRLTPGVQKDSIIVENLSEGDYIFEFRNFNDLGERSLFSSKTVSVWGEKYAEKLHGRKIVSKNFDYETSRYTLEFSDTFKGDHVVYSKIIFSDVHGSEKTVRIDRDVSSVILNDFPDGGELLFQTVFFPPQGIDSVFNAFEKVKAPAVVFDGGEKLSLKGNLTSKYFECNEMLYEWNSDGDLIAHVYENGTFTQKNKYTSLIPRENFRDFFYYDDDKFIGVTTMHFLVMLKITGGGNAEIVKTPQGADTFGSGFSFSQFIPAKGFFFSLGDDELLIWTAKNNATWGNPLGETASDAFFYDPVALYQNKYLIGVDENDFLWNFPVSMIGYLGNKNKIGSGWQRFKKIIPFKDLLLGMDANGDLWKFNFDCEKYWILE